MCRRLFARPLFTDSTRRQTQECAFTLAKVWDGRRRQRKVNRGLRRENRVGLPASRWRDWVAKWQEENRSGNWNRSKKWKKKNVGEQKLTRLQRTGGQGGRQGMHKICPN